MPSSLVRGGWPRYLLHTHSSSSAIALLLLLLLSLCVCVCACAAAAAARSSGAAGLQVLAWCASSRTPFQGVLALDECHRAKAAGATGAGSAVLQLQASLPLARVQRGSHTHSSPQHHPVCVCTLRTLNATLTPPAAAAVPLCCVYVCCCCCYQARVVYSSATSATELHNLQVTPLLTFPYLHPPFLPPFLPPLYTTYNLHSTYHGWVYGVSALRLPHLLHSRRRCT